MSHPGADESEGLPYVAQSSESRKQCKHKIGHFPPHDDAVENSCQYQNCNTCLELGNHLSDCNIYDLPVEILTVIFTLYAASDDHEIQSNRSHGCPPSFILSSICRKWRSIALDLPHIWTNVTINAWIDVSSLDLTKDWLSRSRSLPLSLTIKGPEDSIPPPMSLLESLFQILRSLSGRWEELSVKLPAVFIQRLLRGPEGVHTLDLLRIGNPGRMHHIGRPVVGGADMKTLFAPKRFFARGVNLAHFPLEWSRLTHLDVKDMNVDGIIHILQNATKLETCIARDVDYASHRYPLPDLPITNNSVKFLDTHDFDDNSDLIRYVTFPALETLIYGITGPNDEVNRLANFLDRSKPCLEHFSLLYRTRKAMGHEDWFHIFPTVTHLELVVNESMEHFIHQLTPSVFPKLQELRIITSSMSYEGWKCLAKIFPHDNDEESQDETREKRPLASFSIRLAISTEEPIPKEVYARFVKIRASGVRVEVVGANQVDLLKLSAELYEHVTGQEDNSC